MLNLYKKVLSIKSCTCSLLCKKIAACFVISFQFIIKWNNWFITNTHSLLQWFITNTHSLNSLFNAVEPLNFNPHWYLFIQMGEFLIHQSESRNFSVYNPTHLRRIRSFTASRKAMDHDLFIDSWWVLYIYYKLIITVFVYYSWLAFLHACW